jgi:hypothetical protein
MLGIERERGPDQIGTIAHHAADHWSCRSRRSREQRLVSLPADRRAGHGAPRLFRAAAADVCGPRDGAHRIGGRGCGRLPGQRCHRRRRRHLDLRPDPGPARADRGAPGSAVAPTRCGSRVVSAGPAARPADLPCSARDRHRLPRAARPSGRPAGRDRGVSGVGAGGDGRARGGGRVVVGAGPLDVPVPRADGDLVAGHDRAQRGPGAGARGAARLEPAAEPGSDQPRAAELAVAGARRGGAGGAARRARLGLPR